MKEKVLELPNGNFNNTECFEEIVPMVSQYFIKGGGHYTGNLSERLITCYGKFDNDTNCKNCEKSSLCSKETINLTYNGEIPSVFFDYRARDRVKGINIMVNKTFAGNYCPEKHILSLTDWTHDQWTVSIAKKLLPKLLKILSENYGLTPIDKKKKSYKGKITIGTDPEFEQLNSFSEYQVIKTTYRGTDPNQKIGCDGSGDQIELRPDPAESPLGIVKNLKSLILMIESPISVAGDRYPLGAHIHFGFNPQIANIRTCIKTFVDALDDFLGKPLSTVNGKARGDYAKLSAYEEKKWGFEYRSLPSTYLYSPKTAFIVFKTAYNIIKNLLKEGNIIYKLEKKTINGSKITMPSKEYYLSIAELTEKEYKEFISFIRNFKKHKYKPINGNWGKKDLILINVMLNDDWKNKDFKELLKMRLKERLLELKKGNIVLNINLYGLKQSRGEVVAGFKSSIYNTIEHPETVPFEKSEFFYGLPYSFRVGNISFDLFTTIADEITKDIVEKIAKIN